MTKSFNYKQSMSITTSKILSSFTNIIHGISNRMPGEPRFYNNLSKHVGDDPVTISKNRERFFGELGIEQAALVHANQVHGANVQHVSQPGLYPATDAFITNTPGLFLVISVADCMPVMIYDPVNNAAANIHSGWRGTQKNIAGRAVELLKEKFNSNPAELVVLMGPAISQKNFEVDRDVAELFPKEFIMPKPGAEGKYIIDTGRMVFESLLAKGIKEHNIERSSICTFDDPEMHSYRRDKNLSGRMFAVLGIKKA